MPDLTSQPFSSPADTERIVALLRAVRPKKSNGVYPSPNDLCELLAQPAVQQNTRLWLDPGGNLAAYALVDPYDNLWFEIAAQSGTPALEQEIIGWGFACLVPRIQPNRPQPTLDASAVDSDRPRIALLERNGFERQAVQSLHLERSLAGELATPILPPGFKLRPLSSPAEIHDWVALHRAAHGTDLMTTAERLAMMSAADFDPELDLVIEAPEGRLAAYCLVSIDHAENRRTGRRVGRTDPLATHPDYQRRGLALALLLAGMDLLKARGIETAALTTTTANLSMLAAASKAGYRIVSRRFWYSHPLP